MVEEGEDRGQSAVLVAIAMLVLVIFAAITVDISSAYLGRRTAQNAADGAALAAARQLAYQYNSGVYNDTLIKRELNNFGELNGAEDTGGQLGDEVNTSVTGVYLDKNQHSRGVIGGGIVPADTAGVRATVFITTPAFFGGIMGRSGYPVQANAAVMLELACSSECVVPVATHIDTIIDPATGTTVPGCLNIYNGEGAGNFGWLNWSFQDVHCYDETGAVMGDCSAQCLKQNLDPATCRSGFVYVGEYVAGTSGNENPSYIRQLLKDYVDDQIEFTVVVYDTTDQSQATSGGCAHPYHVVGFARMLLLGFQIPQGVGNAVVYGDTGVDCTNMGLDPGLDPNNGLRLTANFLGWAGGQAGRCRAVSTLRTPTLTE